MGMRRNQRRGVERSVHEKAVERNSEASRLLVSPTSMSIVGVSIDSKRT